MTELESALLLASGPDPLARLAYADWLEEQQRPGWECSWWRHPWVPSEGMHCRINVNRGDGTAYGYGMGDGMGYGEGDNYYWAGGIWKWSYQVEVRRSTQEG